VGFPKKATRVSEWGQGAAEDRLDGIKFTPNRAGMMIGGVRDVVAKLVFSLDCAAPGTAVIGVTN